MASVAAGRLEDKSAFVRKSALGLLITLLQHNPFGPQLRVPAFEATLLRYKEKLHLMQPPPSPPLEGVEDDTNPDVGAPQAPPVGPQQLEESVSDSCQPDQTDTQEEAVPDMGNLEQVRALVASLEAGLQFSRLFTSLMPTLVQLLASPNATDVENTILLLMRCRQFQIDGSDQCLKKMLPLVNVSIDLKKFIRVGTWPNGCIRKLYPFHFRTFRFL